MSTKKDRGGKLDNLLEVSHYLALRAAMGAAGGARSTLFSALEKLADSIEDQLGAAERAQLKLVTAAFHSYEKFPYQHKAAELFWPLVQAIGARRLCRIQYRAPKVNARDKEIKILPLRLFHYQQAVYLHAYVPKHDEVITLNLQRLSELHVLEETGTVPQSYRLDQLEDSAFGIHGGTATELFILRFSEEVAPFIRERVWHRSQKTIGLPDGRLELRFICSPSQEVTSWVASWRDQVEVVAPDTLRAELATLGQWLQRTYGAPVPTR